MVTISVSGRSALMRPIAVTPSMFGISRSIRTTSGSSRRAIATPSEPSAASPTTSMSAWWSKNILQPHPDDRMVVDDEDADAARLSFTSTPGAGAHGDRSEAGGAVTAAGAKSSLAKDRVRPQAQAARSRPAGRDDGGDQLGRAEGLADEAVGAAHRGLRTRACPTSSWPGCGRRARGPQTGDEGEPAIDLGQARIDDDDIGATDPTSARAAPADWPALPTTTHAAADREQPGQALPDPVVGIDDQDAERAVDADSGSGMARW